jgi:hypothetical protein
MKKAVLMYMVLGVALLALAPSAKANYLLPGATVTPDAEIATGTIIADTGWLSFSMLDGTTGLVAEIVVADASNPYASGDLTFIYQVQDTKGTIEHLSGFDFSGFLTDVQAGTGGSGGSIMSGGILPGTVNRVSTGSVVEFNFAPFIGPGKYSSALIIATDATKYKPGTIGIIDGGGAGVVGYAPTVPEPATLSLVGMGLLGLLGLRKKRVA